MAVNPVLVIKVVDNTSVGVRARLYDDFSEHNIVLNSVLTYWWANNMPPAVKFLELFDSVIKRTINEIMPHKTLNLKYEVKADDILENASQIEITLISISADGVGFKIDGKSVFLKDLRKVEEDFEPKEFSTTFDQCIETPDIVLKKYKEMKN
ncbi:hypothetical protein SAMN05216439_1624 [Methanobrevibacter gottschalkii]|uniref:Uncharacterized protein n=2 Tax=Methanobrevibacter gottschalkii TaxID=190974 RepID=A0A3N5BXA3_9EURY|nr:MULTISPECIES: hypothetical protein [Methanobrevibacter]OEC99572.1 hypothetical protein A9505_03515 [Methanobrevibacter sp. A27]RPF50495.1 hypothetical protein EDC42_1774 [Methanobrevibacter gottschalkii DSM 11977]SEK88184.1 hypothetical protein SAMN05216439_1624 [Methanobrevibacter gottschalkii]